MRSNLQSRFSSRASPQKRSNAALKSSSKITNTTACESSLSCFVFFLFLTFCFLAFFFYRGTVNGPHHTNTTPHHTTPQHRKSRAHISSIWQLPTFDQNLLHPVFAFAGSDHFASAIWVHLNILWMTNLVSVLSVLQTCAMRSRTFRSLIED